MGNATFAGLGSEAFREERDIRSVGGQNSNNRPINIELAEEAKANLDIEVPRSPTSYTTNGCCLRLLSY